MWCTLTNGNYINLKQCTFVVAVDRGGGSFGLDVTDVNDLTHGLAGSWSTIGDAQEAARELLNGVDSSTYGD
jgi:hypothetical protein